MLEKTVSLGTTAVGIMKTEHLLTIKLSKDFRINLNNSNVSDLLSWKQLVSVIFQMCAWMLEYINKFRFMHIL